MSPRFSLLLFLMLVTMVTACNELATLPISPLQASIEPSPEAVLQIFVPFAADQPAPTSDPHVTPTIPPTSTPIPTPTATPLGRPPKPPTIFPTPDPSTLTSMGSGTRGQVIQVAGQEIHLPDDAYVEVVIAIAEPVPGRRYPELPLHVLRRGPYTMLVSARNGEMIIFATTAAARNETIQVFDFVIQILGADKIWPPDSSCEDCPIQESPLPTPASQ